MFQMISPPSLQGLVSFDSNGIREKNRIQIYQYRYHGKTHNNRLTSSQSDLDYLRLHSLAGQTLFNIFPPLFGFSSQNFKLRGIKDWVQGFWGYIMAKFESVLRQMKKLKVIVKRCYM